VAVDDAGVDVRQRVQAHADGAAGEVHSAAALGHQLAVALVAKLVPLAQRHEADRQRAGARLGASQVQGVGVATITQADIDLAGYSLTGDCRSWPVRRGCTARIGRRPPGIDLAGFVIDSDPAEGVAAAAVCQLAFAIVSIYTAGDAQGQRLLQAGGSEERPAMATRDLSKGQRRG